MKETEVRGIFGVAGIKVNNTWELINQYWKNVACPSPTGPWWLIETELGMVRIGWRKRVISIDWSTTDTRMIVTEDDVTKGDTYVHAHSIKDAIKYLRKLSA